MSDKDMLGKTNQELQGILRQHNTDGLVGENVAEVQQSMPDSDSHGSDEISIAGRTKMPRPKQQDGVDEKPRYPSQLVDENESTVAKSNVEGVADVGREAARTELQQILKRSPSTASSLSSAPSIGFPKHILCS